jgi:short-subunit dehydrogenase
MKVLITGARSGIGYATALKLLEKGHIVYITVHTDSQLEEIEKKEELKNLNYKCIKLDITDEGDLQKVRDLDIDVLINNAAIGNGGSIMETPLSKIRENFEVNYFGTIRLSKIVLDKMFIKNRGRILMITSMLGEVPLPWLGIYSSTKAALKSISIALNKELKELKSKIKVIIIEPGFYRTGFNNVMLDNKYNEDASNLTELQKRIRSKERALVGFMQSRDITSIVDKIVEAVEAKRPKLIYKAPFIQSIIEKTYMLTQK